MKRQHKAPEKQVNEPETGNFPEKEFRLMIVKITQDLGKTRRCKRCRFQSLCWEDLLEEDMATHSSVLAWSIP